MDPLTYAQSNQAKFLSELNQFLAIPSISTQSEFGQAMHKAADWLRNAMLHAGFPRAQVMPTAGHPIVYGEWLAAGPEAPTVLVYGHYDVQPPDPVSLWHTRPFAPTLVGDNLVARGASDDKGQLFVHLKAVESYHETQGRPPVNVKCLFEGEEEMGSTNLERFVADNAESLQADVAVISDSHILAADTPAIVYALRGICYLEVEVTGPATDLHSGSYGGAVHNPANALCGMIAKLHDENGRITVPGFYDQVLDLDQDERDELAKIPFDRAVWLTEAGVSDDWGETGFSIIERTSARPTLDVNGIWGGYTQPGTKTVLPSKAHAKISMRLVPNQSYQHIYRLVRDHLIDIAPPAVQVDVRLLHGGEGAMVRRDSPEMQAAAKAYHAAFGRAPVYIREGGSIPVVATIQRVLGIESILMGFGLPDDNLHAPNEKMHLPNFYRGIETVIHFLGHLGS